jgi:hypothetical protein
MNVGLGRRKTIMQGSLGFTCLWVGLWFAFGVHHSALSVDVPSILNYQGKLTDNQGHAVTGGYYEIEFRIWDHPTLTGAGHLIWARSFPVHVLPDGTFNILLNDKGGAITNPVSPLFGFLQDAFDGSDRYMGLTVARNPSGPVPSPTEISPRQPLVSVPFAFHAQRVRYAETAATASNALITEGSFTGFVAKSSFPALSDNPKSILSWGSGPTPYKSRMVDYDGKCLVSAGTTSEPPAGVLWEVRGGAIKATDRKIILAGSTNGLEWPLGSAGDANDNAWLRYSGDGSAGTVELAVGNDTNDTLALTSSGDIRIMAASNSTLLLQGQVQTIGGLALYHNQDVDEIAQCDAFYTVVFGFEAYCTVDITPRGQTNVYSRRLGIETDGEALTLLVAKGDRFHLYDRTRVVQTWRRDIGLVAP